MRDPHRPHLCVTGCHGGVTPRARPAPQHQPLPTHGVPTGCSQLPHTTSFVAPLKTRSMQHTAVHLYCCFPVSKAVNYLLFKQQFLKQNQKPAPGQMCARQGRVCYLSSSQAVCYANKPHTLFSQPPADFATNFVSEENTLCDINAAKSPETFVHNFVTNIDQSIFVRVWREKPTNKTKHIWGDFFLLAQRAIRHPTFQ